MRFCKSMYVWTRDERVEIIPWPDHGGLRKDYQFSGGACSNKKRSLSGDSLLCAILLDFHHMVVRDGVCPKAAHRAFLKIDEYREAMSLDCL